MPCSTRLLRSLATFLAMFCCCAVLAASTNAQWNPTLGVDNPFQVVPADHTVRQTPAPPTVVNDPALPAWDPYATGCKDCQPKYTPYEGPLLVAPQAPIAASYGSWWENMEMFLAADGWATRADDQFRNNFGFRGGLNGSFGIGNFPVRLQLGASYGAYDIHGRDDSSSVSFALFGGPLGVSNRSSSAEEQVFVTAGLYKRSRVDIGDRWSAGAVYDLLMDDNFGYYGSYVVLSQVRGVAGYALTDRDEIGGRMAFRLNQESIVAPVISSFTFPVLATVSVNAQDQISLYWKRHWQLGADTTAFVGWADDPGEIVIGADGRAPLSERFALFGAFTYFIPSANPGDGDLPPGHPVAFPNDGLLNRYSEETWNVSFGIVFYPGANARSRNVSGNLRTPLLPVADNGSFAVQAPVGTL